MRLAFLMSLSRLRSFSRSLFSAERRRPNTAVNRRSTFRMVGLLLASVSKQALITCNTSSSGTSSSFTSIGRNSPRTMPAQRLGMLAGLFVDTAAQTRWPQYGTDCYGTAWHGTYKILTRHELPLLERRKPATKYVHKHRKRIMSMN